MKLIVDADSCPRQIRTIIMKAASRIDRRAVFVADRELNDCTGAGVTMEVVEPGDDHADDRVVELCEAGDLIITRDVLLASRVVASGCVAVDDRGGVFTEENMGERVSMRNAMKAFREAGLFSQNHKPIGKKEIQLFSNALDTHLTRLLRGEHR